MIASHTEASVVAPGKDEAILSITPKEDIANRQTTEWANGTMAGQLSPLDNDGIIPREPCLR